jgi:cytochrome c-type biogenesis protein CcmE
VVQGPINTPPTALEARRIVAKASSTYLYADRERGPDKDQESG